MIEMMMGGGSVQLPRCMISLEDGAITILPGWSVTMLPDFLDLPSTASTQNRAGAFSPCGNYFIVAYQYGGAGTDARAYYRLWDITDLNAPVVVRSGGYGASGSHPDGNVGVSRSGEYFFVGERGGYSSNRLYLFKTDIAQALDTFSGLVNYAGAFFVGSGDDFYLAICTQSGSSRVILFDITQGTERSRFGDNRVSCAASIPGSSVIVIFRDNITSANNYVSTYNIETEEIKDFPGQLLRLQYPVRPRFAKIGGETYLFLPTNAPNTTLGGHVVKWDGGFDTEPVIQAQRGPLLAYLNNPFDITDNGSIAKVSYSFSSSRDAELIIKGESFYPSIESMIETEAVSVPNSTLIAPIPEVWSTP